MDAKEDAGRTMRRGRDEAPDELLLAPAAILEGLPDAVVAVARGGQIVLVNALAEQLFGYARVELLGRSARTLWPERLRERYARNLRLSFATEHPMRFSSEVWGLRRDGSEFAGEMSWGVVKTAAGPLLLAIGRDVSERRAAEARLRALAEIGDRALAGADQADLAADAVRLTRSALPVAGVQVRLTNGAVMASDGSVAADAVRMPIGDDEELLVTPERDLDQAEMTFLRSVANTLASGLARRRGEEQLRHEAVHDPLTGLANRTLLHDRLEHALARSEREGGETGVVFVDLDDFKLVNDAFGHAAGDAVLVELARRLQSTVRPADTVARLGGDEFVVVCEQVDRDSALALGRRLQRAVELPLAVGEATHELSVSIGIALGHAGPDALLASADAALYGAKAGGGGRVMLSE